MNKIDKILQIQSNLHEKFNEFVDLHLSMRDKDFKTLLFGNKKEKLPKKGRLCGSSFIFAISTGSIEGLFDKTKRIFICSDKATTTTLNELVFLYSIKKKECISQIINYHQVF